MAGVIINFPKRPFHKTARNLLFPAVFFLLVDEPNEFTFCLD
jgi:hypothetical protein